MIELLSYDLSPQMQAYAHGMAMGSDAPYHTLELLIQSDWRVCVEGGLEDYHVPYVHPETFHELDIQIQHMTRYGRNSVAVYEIGSKRVRTMLDRMSKYFPYSTPNRYTHMFIYPNICAATVGGFTYSLMKYQPVGGRATRMTCRMYAGKVRQKAPDMTTFFEQAAAFNLRVFREDAAMCERVRSWSIDEDAPLHPSEERVRWFREELRKEPMLCPEGM